ncbi:hypothetical protein EVAR_5008_1 [Eumeta japonica]|uniref:Uncharacterized protein n=1 Tax=Eumeta variegata TaxID=151549 RepID=A0A4C1SUP0_EUMVA|nr:hypothetical protein EVAR_5008_1 [Eumeta japonica]
MNKIDLEYLIILTSRITFPPARLTRIGTVADERRAGIVLTRRFVQIRIVTGSIVEIEIGNITDARIESSNEIWIENKINQYNGLKNTFYACTGESAGIKLVQYNYYYVLS